MHNCAFCRQPLRPWSEWKGNDGRLYCGEFCADAGVTLHTSVKPEPTIAHGSEVRSTLDIGTSKRGEFSPL